MRSSEPGPTSEGFAHSPGGGSDQTSSTVPASTMARTLLPVRRATGLRPPPGMCPPRGPVSGRRYMRSSPTFTSILLMPFM
jgi:hypothetical protein